MENRTLLKKRLIAISLVVITLFVLQFIVSRSLLTVTATGGKEISVQITQGSDTKNFTLSDGASKTLLLNSGEHTVTLTEGNKVSFYQKKLGFFWLHKLEGKLEPQKQALSLGPSQLGCAQDDGEMTFYYSCGEFEDRALIRTMDGIQIEGASFNETSEEETGGVSKVVQPLGDHFISVRAASKTMTISKHNSSGDLVSPAENTIKDFGGTLTANTVATSRFDNDKTRLAILDSQNKVLFDFGGSPKNNPKKIDVSKFINTETGHATKVKITNDAIYIFNLLNPDYVRGDSDTDEPVFAKGEEQSIVRIDSRSGKIKDYPLDSSFLVSVFSVSPDGDILLKKDIDPDQKLYLSEQAGDIKEFKDFNLPVTDMCWKNSEAFYYTADEGESLFLHSTKTHGSQLVHATGGSAITSLNCINDKLYVTTNSSNNAEDQANQHYVITNNSQVGAPAESIFPMYEQVQGTPFKGTIYKNTVNVYPLDPAIQPNDTLRSKAKQTFIELLKDSDIKTEDLTFTYQPSGE